VSNRVEALVKAIRGLPRTLDNGFIYNIATKRHFIYHYRNSGLCRVPDALPSAFSRALGKEAFAESRIR
jgi:hypothetical protein